MNTMIVDDRIAVVNMMKIQLLRIDPTGEHIGFTDPKQALTSASATVYDIAFLDIEMPNMSGIMLAKELQKINPVINIVFITGHSEYMPNAFELYASDYIMKPITENKLRRTLDNLRHKPINYGNKALKVRCFGSFEVFVNDSPMEFPREKCKELFAYLIDRRGAVCSPDMIIGNLWCDMPADESQKAKLRVTVNDMIKAFAKIGADDVIIRKKNGVAVNASAVDCDYYRWLDGDPSAQRQFLGQYMSQYDFAEETQYNLQVRGRKG